MGNRSSNITDSSSTNSSINGSTEDESRGESSRRLSKVNELNIEMRSPSPSSSSSSSSCPITTPSRGITEANSSATGRVHPWLSKANEQTIERSSSSSSSSSSSCPITTPTNSAAFPAANTRTTKANEPTIERSSSSCPINTPTNSDVIPAVNSSTTGAHPFVSSLLTRQNTDDHIIEEMADHITEEIVAKLVATISLSRLGDIHFVGKRRRRRRRRSDQLGEGGQAQMGNSSSNITDGEDESRGESSNRRLSKANDQLNIERSSCPITTTTNSDAFPAANSSTTGAYPFVSSLLTTQQNTDHDHIIDEEITKRVVSISLSDHVNDNANSSSSIRLPCSRRELDDHIHVAAEKVAGKKKRHRNKLKKKERWIAHYSSSHKILLVGEGDFSFSACLARAFLSATNIIATTLESEETLLTKHWSSEPHIEELRRLGGLVLYKVDANDMNWHPILMSMKFDRIVYNFPHAGHFSWLCERDSDLIKIHKELLLGFFKSSSKMLSEEGEVHVSHRDDYPYNRWKIQKLAKKAGLRLKEKVEFCKSDYPGYHNKRAGGIQSNKKFPLPPGDCFTFKFSLVAPKS